MTRATAYDQFVSREWDPVSCLEPAGINDSNKFNILRLAGVLASFGDFKDKKYRLKIRKDQSTMIQAVRYLLEKSVSEPNLGKRQLHETTSDVTDMKKRKTHEGTVAESSSLRAEYELEACISPGSVREAEVEAALTLQDLAKKCTTKETSLSSRNAHICDAVRHSNMSKSISFSMENTSASRACMSEATQTLTKAHFELATDWHLDFELHGTRLRDIIVIVRGTALPSNEWWYGAYEGKYARVISLLSKMNESLASVKLLKARPSSKEHPSACNELELDEEVELNIPAHFLVPILPEKCGDQVVVLHEKRGGSKLKGTHWQVRAFVAGQKFGDGSSDSEDEGEDEEALDLVEVESEVGHLRLPRAHLAKCFSSND